MKLKLFLSAFTAVSFMLALPSCGNAQKSDSSNSEAESEASAQDEADEQFAEVASLLGSIDWAVEMPKIVKSLPKETVHSQFVGKIGADSIDCGDFKACPYFDNFYTQSEMEGEEHYLFSVLAAPYSDGENVFVIVQSQAGVDGLATLLLKTMDYNLKTGEFSNISDALPGVEPSADLLDLSWLSDHPDWVNQIKNEYTTYSTYDLISNDGLCIVKNCFNDNDVCYSIYDEMTDDVPDWSERLNLFYVWDGKSFKLAKREKLFKDEN